MEKRNYLFKKIIFIFSVLFSIVFAGTDGTIRGKVSDSDGNPLPGAQIYIKSLQLGAIVGVDGGYILLNIPVGEYAVTVSMMGYRQETQKNVQVKMDQTVWLNFALPIAAVEGEEVVVTAERPLIDPGSTSKKITIGEESIESLPIRDVSELYSLQSGVVRVQSRKQAIPDHEERGLEEIHVRGGRSGEIAYMIDGMYIRNPIFGGIGTGTRLNLFAIKEWDWQPGGFNAEYGDAMSAVSNFHTKSGERKFAYKFKYESSMLGASSGSEYDELRGYNDYSMGFGGALPGYEKLRYWVSGQYSDYKSYRVYEFDDVSYIEDDPGNQTNYQNLVHPFDTKAGYRGFGFDKTWDVFSKVSYNPTNKLRFNLTHWFLTAHRKIFNPNSFLYWDLGQNELFRDTQRFAFEFNHQLTSKTFYTVRLSRFEQGSFSGVRLKDSDDDGYPDWFEWSHSAGERGWSDPYNADVIPYATINDTVFYTKRDGEGPGNWTSGWYYGAPEQGNYNWGVAEDFNDINYNGIWDEGEGFTDANNNEAWDGPILTDESIYRDGDYWLTPEMYVDHKQFYDNNVFFTEWLQDPYLADGEHLSEFFDQNGWFMDNIDSLYFMGWYEGQSFGGHDRFFNTSLATTNELRFDITSQLTNKLKVRTGFDYKYHGLNYFDVEYPWRDVGAYRQRFAEQWNDTGLDGIDRLDPNNPLPNNQADTGEGNGVWDGGFGESFSDRNGNGIWDDAEPFKLDVESNGVYDDGDDYYDLNLDSVWTPAEEFVDLNGNEIFEPGESFSDFNGNGQWDDFVEPEEISAYLQTTFEVPWMIVNAGVRMDAVNYNSKVWGDPLGKASPGRPWVFGDFGRDGIKGGVYSQDDWENEVREWGDREEITIDPEDINVWNEYWNIQVREDDYIILKPDYSDGEGNGNFDSKEPYSDDVGDYESVIFNDSQWFYKISPRIGISHIITDKVTFVFNYGLYYQTPIYEMVYLNTNRQENPNELFQHAQGEIGNATMNAARTQSYELGFNAQIGRRWGLSIMVWAKDMDQLATAQTYRSSVYEYQISANGDYGEARGIDFTLENRGKYINSLIQYTFSKAKANGEYDKSAFGAVWVDAPSQQYLMPYDRPHDLTISMNTKKDKLPLGIRAGLTGFYQSGYPYTPMVFNGNRPQSDEKNKNSKRAPAYKNFDLLFTKELKYYDMKVSLGVNIYNVFDLKVPMDVFDLTGEPDDPGEYYTQDVGEFISGSYFDFPWYYSTPREVNFTVRFDFR